jgi:hypothetical protein
MRCPTAPLVLVSLLELTAAAAAPEAPGVDVPPFAALRPLGRAMAQLIGQPCPADRSSDVGARVSCDKRGRVVVARLELDGWSRWGMGRGLAPLGTPSGLREFAEGSWGPAGPHNARASAMPHGLASYEQGRLLWLSRTCPPCRRAYVYVTVGLAERAIRLHGRARWPPDAPDRHLARARQLVRRAFVRSTHAGCRLLRHKDSVVRAVALTQLPAEMQLGDPLLRELLADSDPAVRRGARKSLVRQFSTLRVPYLRQAIARAHARELATIVRALQNDRRWFGEPSIRAVLRRAAEYYPELQVRRAVAEALEYSTPKE